MFGTLNPRFSFQLFIPLSERTGISFDAVSGLNRFRLQTRSSVGSRGSLGQSNQGVRRSFSRSELREPRQRHAALVVEARVAVLPHASNCQRPFPTFAEFLRQTHKHQQRPCASPEFVPTTHRPSRKRRLKSLQSGAKAQSNQLADRGTHPKSPGMNTENI